ncbi:MAG: zf-HC2 domain-containing protein [Gemmatimonadaceae bacterium]|nr:zf-HC2 domain-containing protein [Gemmatimonadaceae bacterium]
MTECLNEDLRDLLPLLAHGSLPAAEAARLRAHVAACAACTAELASLESIRQVLAARAPQLDVSAIAMAVTAATSRGTPVLRVVPGDAPAVKPSTTTSTVAPRRSWVPRHSIAAAASILVVVSLSIPLLRPDASPDTAPLPMPTVAGPAVASPIDTPDVTTPDVVPAVAASEGLVVADGLSDLSDAALESLLMELETLEATVSAEPGSLRRPLVATPGGL